MKNADLEMANAWHTNIKAGSHRFAPLITRVRQQNMLLEYNKAHILNQ